MDEHIDKTSLFGEIPGPPPSVPETSISLPATKYSVPAPGRFTDVPPSGHNIRETTAANDDDIEEFDSDTDSDMVSDSGQSEDLNAGFRQRIIQVASASQGFFKHQQRGDPDLTRQEKQKIVSQLLDSRPAVFLQRFGRFLSEDHLAYFEDITDQNFEVEHYLGEARQRQCKYVQDHKIKNRRFNALQKMISEGDDHFSEEQMRMRNPLLYDQLVGNYQTQEERSEEERPDMTNCSLSNIIIEHMDLNRMRDLKKRLEAVDDEELDSDDEDVEAVNSASGNRPPEEKTKLRQEFVNSAYQSFLAGKDSGIDYSKIDDNPDLDDMTVENLENEERYFDQDDIDE